MHNKQAIMRRVLKNIERTRQSSDHIYGTDTQRRTAILNDCGVCDKDWQYKKLDTLLQTIPPGLRYQCWGYITDLRQGFHSRSFTKNDYEALTQLSPAQFLEQVLADNTW